MELVNSFRYLSTKNKQVEILDNLNQLLKLLYVENGMLDSTNEVLPVINNY